MTIAESPVALQHTSKRLQQSNTVVHSGHDLCPGTSSQNRTESNSSVQRKVKAKETERLGATFQSQTPPKGRKKTIASLTRKVVSIPPTFNKCEELFMFDSIAPHVNLQRQQQGEEELVLLVQASRRILVNLKGHKLNDVGDAFAGDGAFRGPDGGGEKYL